VTELLLRWTALVKGLLQRIAHRYMRMDWQNRVQFLNPESAHAG
jgi:hypothetical protein